MSFNVRVEAPAKINIGLRVLPSRKDGYHGIESVFQRIPFYDILTISYSSVIGRKCIVDCNKMLLPENNTVALAYKAFCELTGFSDSVYVHLEKHIPAGAGLGGGSSDAAALVNALEQVHGEILTNVQRKAIAAAVGSDVFFFLDKEAMNQGCAVVSGRGEELNAFSARKDIFFILICPDVHSSTKEAYQLVDAWYGSEWKWSGLQLASLVEEYVSCVKNWRFINSFEEPLKVRYPEIGTAIKDLQHAGAAFVQMSGSGSSVYGVFDLSAKADEAFLMLCKKWKHCYLFASS